MDFAPLIKEIGRGTRGARDLTREQAHALFGGLLDGTVPDLERGAILIAMRIKGESLEELLGFEAAMQERTARLQVPEGPRLVLLPAFNGARKQANLMPLVALLLARAGIPVLIHGRHDFDSRISPFELLDALGLPAAGGVAQAQAQLLERHLAVLPLALLNPGIDALMALRPRMGVRNSSHSVAKLLDPAPGRSVRVVAVTHPEYVDSMGAALPLLSLQGSRALLMRASEGEAYLHLRRKAHLQGFVDGQAWDLQPSPNEDLEVPLSTACEPAENAALIRAMLAGETAIPERIGAQVAALERLARG
ncbi:Anthranilate phosphoribosyltransferase [Roseateles sp. YR242]|uniref:DNA-binding protein YbiB n=1 Tax=Roseateles sp. YR242 TaxID=1855305 RepID=UPI0008CCED61|nr:DNA-binding protein YbiB [Roseateles sp. YR242]SEK53497.1 Anthranilate phosphoribosyltransferase [Roseateles sp. YR242]